MDNEAWPHYKLTNEPKGSGELKIWRVTFFKSIFYNKKILGWTSKFCHSVFQFCLKQDKPF